MAHEGRDDVTSGRTGEIAAVSHVDGVGHIAQQYGYGLGLCLGVGGLARAVVAIVSGHIGPVVGMPQGDGLALVAVIELTGGTMSRRRVVVVFHYLGYGYGDAAGGGVA